MHTTSGGRSHGNPHPTAGILIHSGSAAAAWPVAADAQQPAVPVIGVLFGGSPTTQRFRLNAIQGGLNAVGFVEGQNVAFEYRWAEGQYDRLPGLAAELAGRRVTVIVAIGNTAALAAKSLSGNIKRDYKVFGA